MSVLNRRPPEYVPDGYLYRGTGMGHGTADTVDLDEAPVELEGISSVAATVRKALDAVARAERERDEARELLRRVRCTYAWTPHGWHQTSLGARTMAGLLSEIDAHLGVS